MRLIMTALLTLWIFTIPSGSLFLPVTQAASSGPNIGPVAWIDVGGTIDLNKARTLFTTISSETADEIVGTYSIYINSYITENITENINLYVGKSGLIAGYYDSYTPGSKTVLWNSDKIFFSKLASVVTVGQSLGYKVSIKDVKYYDYRYPDANRLLMVTQSLGEQYIGNYDYGSFNFNIPSDATVYETSYSIYLNDIYNTQPAATIAIDESITE